MKAVQKGWFSKCIFWNQKDATAWENFPFIPLAGSRTPENPQRAVIQMSPIFIRTDFGKFIWTFSQASRLTKFYMDCRSGLLRLQISDFSPFSAANGFYRIVSTSYAGFCRRNVKYNTYGSPSISPWLLLSFFDFKALTAFTMSGNTFMRLLNNRKSWVDSLKPSPGVWLGMWVSAQRKAVGGMKSNSGALSWKVSRNCVPTFCSKTCTPMLETELHGYFKSPQVQTRDLPIFIRNASALHFKYPFLYGVSPQGINQFPAIFIRGPVLGGPKFTATSRSGRLINAFDLNSFNWDTIGN